MKNKKPVNSTAREKPTIATCIEGVLANGPQLIYATIDGLLNSVERHSGLGSAQMGQSPVLVAAVQRLATEREAVAQHFLGKLRGYLYAGLGSLGQVRQIKSLHELRLFDEDTSLGDSIELAQAEQEMFQTVAKTLPQLDALISSLLGWITVQPQMNPLRPSVFVHAMRDALKALIPDESVRSQLMTPAAGRMGIVLNKLYKKIIDWLLMHGVEPAGAALSLESGPAGSQNTGAVVSATVAKTILTLNKVKRLLTGQDGSELPSDALGKRGSGYLHTVPFSLGALDEDDGMLEAMAENLEQQEKEDPEALSRRQEEIRQALSQGQSIGKLLGSEVARMLLDQQLKDRRLVPAVRELLQALEPSLKDMAELDARLFSEEEHPVRQYLSAIVNRALGFSSESDEGFTPFYRSVKDSVTVVAQEYARNPQTEAVKAVYTFAWHELLEAWQHADQAALAKKAEMEKVLLLAEQRNFEALRLAAEFRELMHGIDAPELVHGFITGVWSQVVAKSVVHAGPSRSDTQDYMGVVGDLLWSIQPVLASKDRTRLASLIPSMLGKIRSGAQSINYPYERLNAVLDELLQIHQRILGERHLKLQADLYHVEDDGTAAPAPAPEVAAAAYTAPVVKREAAGPSAFIDVERAEQLLRQPQAASPAQASLLERLRLKMGTWIELYTEDDGWKRVQLTWQSPKKTMYVFISSSGSTHSMNTQSLERLLEDGKIRPLLEQGAAS